MLPVKLCCNVIGLGHAIDGGNGRIFLVIQPVEVSLCLIDCVQRFLAGGRFELHSLLHRASRFDFKDTRMSHQLKRRVSVIGSAMTPQLWFKGELH